MNEIFYQHTVCASFTRGPMIPSAIRHGFFLWQRHQDCSNHVVFLTMSLAPPMTGNGLECLYHL